jgi:uncharacterized protein YbjT (DUF2867 family)
VEAAFLLQPPIGDMHAATTQFLDAATAAGVRRVVRLSVLSADPHAGFTFGREHGVADDLLRGSGLGYTILRPGSFMQNWTEYYGVTAANGGTVYLAQGDAPIAWIDARDIGAVAAAALADASHAGKQYDLTGPEALSTGDAAAQLSAALGKPVTYVALTDDAARAGMRAQNMPDAVIGPFLELARFIREGGASRITTDVKTVLGREARTFRAFAADVAAGRV